MKTIITFIPEISRMLQAGGYNETQLLNACQSAANDVPAEFAGSKRSAFVHKSKGTEVHWSEQDKQEYKAKSNSPLAFVAWHDATAKLHKVHGSPSGEMTPDAVPTGLRIWLDTKFRSAPAPAEDNGRGVTPAPVAPTNGKHGKRNVTPTNGKHKRNVAPTNGTHGTPEGAVK